VTPARTKLIAKIAVVLAAAAILLAAHQLGIFEQFADPAGMKRALVDLGPRGYAAFIVAYALLQPFGFPGSLFIWSAPLIWPWPVAFALSMTGTMAASVVGFLFARFIARDWVAARIPARFRRHDEALARHALATVFVLRLVFWMPPPLHAFFGVSRVSFATHFWGSLAGYVPPLLLVSMFGEQMFDVAMSAPLELWLGLGLGLGVLGLLAWALRRRRAAARPAPSAADADGD
jgi:uncharacterized membrane protein YdjX (TVP38/TMEM64 family)